MAYDLELIEYSHLDHFSLHTKKKIVENTIKWCLTLQRKLILKPKDWAFLDPEFM